MSTRSTSVGDALSRQTIVACGPSMLSTLPSDQVLPAQWAITTSPTAGAGGLASAVFSELAVFEFPALELSFLPIPQAVNSAIEKRKTKTLFIGHNPPLQLWI